MYHVNENLSPLLRLDSFTTLQKAGHWKASKNMVSGSEADLDERCIHNFRLEVGEVLPFFLDHSSREIVHHLRHLRVEIIR